MSRDPEPNLRGSYRLLATAARLVQRRQDEALAPLGLTRAAVIALEAVAPRPLNQEQLAAKVHVQSQTLGRVLARLESQGLVTRTRNETDRRQLHVELTEAGKGALDAAHEAENSAFPAAMDVEGWEILQQQLARFVDSLQGPLTGSKGRPRATGSADGAYAGYDAAPAFHAGAGSCGIGNPRYQDPPATGVQGELRQDRIRRRLRPSPSDLQELSRLLHAIGLAPTIGLLGAGLERRSCI